MKNILQRLMLAVIVTVCASTNSWAQSTAQINGTVRDQTGAVLPGVEVTATQADTGVARTAVTDETGSYILQSLPIGPYRVEASLPGFRTYVQTGIVLQVNSNPQVNAVLSVGQVSEQVEVQANAALVETRSTGIAQIMENERILELPLNGRQVTELIMGQGATVQGYNSGANNGGGRNYPTIDISIAGGSATGIGYMLDGASHRDMINSQNLPLPFPDALQEFKLETSALPAQYFGSSAVNAVTKSGTNEIHGGFFEFFRDGHLNARNTFASARDQLKRNQFGGTVGGPIIKNKVFFFAGHQATVVRSAPSSQRAYIPTAEMLAGDFTAFAAPACNAQRQLTLTPAAGFVNNKISPSAFSPQALNLIARLPKTTNPCGEVIFQRSDATTENLTIGRMDYQINQKHSLFGRFQMARLDSPNDFDANNVLALSRARQAQRVYSFALGDTYLIGSGTVSNFRATINRSRNPRDPVHFFDWQDLGVNVYVVEPDLLYNTFGTFSISSVNNAPTKFNGLSFQLAEDISTVKGAHQIGFGAIWGWTSLNQRAVQQSTGQFTFNGQTTTSSLVDFMLGKPSQWQQSGVPTQYGRQYNLGAYGQDTWKVGQRLTVNYGVRWDPFFSWHEKFSRQVHFDKARFDQGLRSSVYVNAPTGLIFPGDPGMPEKSAHFNRYGDFAPRFGLAWDPQGTGRMTIRTAYGLFFDQVPQFFYYPIANDAPFGNSIQIPSPTGGFADPWLGYPGGNPFPIAPTANTPFFQNSPYVSYPLHIKHTYTNQWNLSLQRQLGENWLVSANYLGSNSVHLYTSKNINPAVYFPGSNCTLPNGTVVTGTCSTTGNTTTRRLLTIENRTWGPYYGAVSEVDDGGTGNYHALLLTAQHRISKGLSLQGNYTWAHCISDQVSTNPGGAAVDYNNFNRRFDRGNCSTQDRRHVAHLGTVYSIPRYSNAAMGAIFGGWQVAGNLTLSSGSAMEVSSGADTALTGITSGRADQLLPDVYNVDKNADHWFNPLAFGRPANGAWGNMGRNSLRGPGKVTINVGFTRTLRLRETQSFQIRAEFFNLPNHVNLQNPGLNLTNTTTFGRITTADDPRIIQLALKYAF